MWHNIPVGPFGRHPDFVAPHPHQGIVVLEVKDWHRDTIVGATSTHVEYLTPQGTVSLENSFEQVRKYMFAVAIRGRLRIFTIRLNKIWGNLRGRPRFPHPGAIWKPDNQLPVP